MGSPAEVLLIKVNQLDPYRNDLIYDERNRESANSDNTGFIIIDLINRSIYWSMFFLKTLGFNPNESPSTFDNLEELLHPSDKFIVENILSNENTEKELFYKLRFRTNNQTYVLLHSYLKTIN